MAGPSGRIKSYNFGEAVIGEKTYTRDVIIYPDKIESDWWRIEGHELCVRDIEHALKEKSSVLLVGTGYYGNMKILDETKAYLRSRGIELVAERTTKACEIYNKMRENAKIVAALHLTC